MPQPLHALVALPLCLWLHLMAGDEAQVQVTLRHLVTMKVAPLATLVSFVHLHSSSSTQSPAIAQGSLLTWRSMALIHIRCHGKQLEHSISVSRCPYNSNVMVGCVLQCKLQVLALPLNLRTLCL